MKLPGGRAVSRETLTGRRDTSTADTGHREGVILHRSRAPSAPCLIAYGEVRTQLETVTGIQLDPVFDVPGACRPLA